jgi:hypothetical protein
MTGPPELGKPRSFWRWVGIGAAVLAVIFAGALWHKQHAAEESAHATPAAQQTPANENARSQPSRPDADRPGRDRGPRPGDSR